jgi:hypothetical protein
MQRALFSTCINFDHIAMKADPCDPTTILNKWTMLGAASLSESGQSYSINTIDIVQGKICC